MDSTSAISFQNATDITIDGITVQHTAGNGIDFTPCLAGISPFWCTTVGTPPVAARAAIINSTFWDIGVGGIRIGQNAVNGLEQSFTDANSPQNFIVWNNLVAGYGRVIPAAFGIGQGVGHDNIYARNEVYDGYHCAISISHGGGGTVAPNGLGNANNAIAFNLVYNLLQGIMNDGGSLRIEAGNQAGTSPGNRIFDNVVHDTSDASIIDNGKLVPYIARPGYGGDGIYLDNSTGGVDVFNNLVYRVSDTAVYTPHGPSQRGAPNLVHNNILAYARRAMIAVNDPYQGKTGPNFQPTLSFVVESNIMFFDRNNVAPAPFTVEGNCTFPGDTDGTLLPFTGFEKFAKNLYWSTIDQRNFATTPDGFQVQTVTHEGLNTGDPCGPKPLGVTPHPYSLTQWMHAFGEDIGSQVGNPFSPKAVYPLDDFSVAGPIPAIGFLPFASALAGRTPSMPRPPQVAPTFPTSPYDPASAF